MARKSITWTATDGRDAGKKFELTEMSATDAEWWAIRLFLAMGRGGIETPPELAAQGMLGLVSIALTALVRINPVDAKPLLDDMMACVKINPSANITRDLIEDDIDEVLTRFKLKKAVFDLHTDFFAPAAGSTSESTQAATPENILNIKINPQQSPQ